MEESKEIVSAEQNSNRPSHLFKKGQSGNPSGRPKGTVSLKEYARRMLQAMTEEERQEYLGGLPKELIWKMGEGNPETKIDAKMSNDDQFTPEEIEQAKAFFKLNGRNEIKKTIELRSGDGTDNLGVVSIP